MSATARQFTFDAATHELWRVAECGDVDALADVLSHGVDVNTRNQHGVTALMRAAANGHHQMVRALLQRGADPNITRNDKFTALALAAFFGHTETVRMLIETGAKTEVVTRSGTSPKMWATARTFTDAARCFEQRAPAPVAKPAVSTPAKVVAIPTVIKTLKDPPEIWDLVQVHEVPRGFNARSAFFARIGSMNRTVAFAALAVVLLVVAGGVGALVLRSSQASNLPPEIPPVQAATETTVSPPVNVESSTTIAPPEVTDEFLSAHVVKKATRPTRRRPVTEGNVIEVAPSSEAPAPATSQVATPQFEKPKAESPAKSTPNTALSPQLITPAKTAPPKGKVIQWP